MKRFNIETDDGGGEAIQEKLGEAWQISVPQTDFKWHGSIPEIKREIQRRFPDARFEEAQVQAEQTKEVTLKSLRSAMRDLGHTPPYLWEISRAEVEKWMKEYLTQEQITQVYKSAGETP
jgi:hypothetical protein